MAEEEKKKVLLIEPNYANKFPPIALMKIATYYRNLGGWETVFYKGDLTEFVVGRLATQLADRLKAIDIYNTNWLEHSDRLARLIRTGQRSIIQELPIDANNSLLLNDSIEYSINLFRKGLWKLPENREWDRVHITTLFTFYWDITLDTIVFAADLVKQPKDLRVGGVLASLQPRELRQELARRLGKAGREIGIHTGILRAGDLDAGDTQPIDELELDYSILDEIDYRYPMANAYYRYATRGCVNKCAFCAVPILEPVYQPYIPLRERIARINALYGEQKDLLLMDNNVLASSHFPRIIQEIIDCGFGKGAKFIQPDPLAIAMRNLRDKVNNRAYVRKAWRLIDEFYNALPASDSYAVYKIREKYSITLLATCTRDNLIAAYGELKGLYEKRYKRGRGKLRVVDFNQGLDARLFTQEKADLLGKIAIKPVRIAFDDIRTRDAYVRAIRMCVRAGITNFSNYLLYNYNDTPADLYNRLKINVDLCDDLGISIYSFPMKYHPIRKTKDMDADYSHNRNYVGKHWCRKHIRAIQAILNSTKGKIGRGTSFFAKAFGNSLEEYDKLLDMPEHMIIYRLFFEWLGSQQGRRASRNLIGKDCYGWSTDAWWETYQKCRASLPANEWRALLDFIRGERKGTPAAAFAHENAQKLIAFYANRSNFLNKNNDLRKLKKAFDSRRKNA